LFIEIVPILSMQFEKVHYYTVRLDGHKKTQFRDFMEKMTSNEPNRFELSEISGYIETIGKRTGAKPHHFRDEGAADGLPPPYHQFLESDDPNDFGLRLYCIRLCNTVVILLNGDRKTALKVKDCGKCYPHFELARKIANSIDKAIVDGNIEICEEDKEIVIEEDFQLNI
jgi:hypothetical protein